MSKLGIVLAGMLIAGTANATWGSRDDNSTNVDTEVGVTQLQGQAQIANAEGGNARAYGGRSSSDATGVGVGIGGRGGQSDSTAVGINDNTNRNNLENTNRSSNRNSNDSSALSGSVSGAVSGAANEGNNTEIEGDTYVSRNRALALALPAATPGVGASAPCLVTTRGATIVGSGWSGSTKIDSGCYEDLRIQKNFENCMVVADAYARIGNEHLLVSQLEQCRSLAID